MAADTDSDGDADESDEFKETLEALAGQGRVEVDRLSDPGSPVTVLDTPEGTIRFGSPHSASHEGSDLSRYWHLWGMKINYSIDQTPGNRTHTLLVKRTD